MNNELEILKKIDLSSRLQRYKGNGYFIKCLVNKYINDFDRNL